MPISAPEPAAGPLLAVSGLAAGYGKLKVIEQIDLRIAAGEVVALVGPNGAGKTTLLRAISCLIPKSAGSVRFAGANLTKASAQDSVRAGLVHVIEGHRVFSPLSVEDNLLLAAFNAPASERAQRLEEAYDAFPEIRERRAAKAGALSGGQQQMLVVAQGIVRRPRLLMLDEPSAGLSPVLVDRVLEVAQALSRKGTAILLTEQLVEKALSIAARVYALARGRIVLDCAAQAARAPGVLERAYLGTAATETTSQ